MDTKSHFMSKLLMQSILQYDLESSAELLRRATDPNLVLVEGATPFHIAAGVNEHAEDFTKLILENGGNPNIMSVEGVTPLHVACLYDHCAVTKLLLEHGADPLLKDNEEQDAFAYAETSGCQICQYRLYQSVGRPLPQKEADEGRKDASQKRRSRRSLYTSQIQTLLNEYDPSQHIIDVTSPDHPQLLERSDRDTTLQDFSTPKYDCSKPDACGTRDACSPASRGHMEHMCGVYTRPPETTSPETHTESPSPEVSSPEFEPQSTETASPNMNTDSSDLNSPGYEFTESRTPEDYVKPVTSADLSSPEYEPWAPTGYHDNMSGQVYPKQTLESPGCSIDHDVSKDSASPASGESFHTCETASSKGSPLLESETPTTGSVITQTQHSSSQYITPQGNTPSTLESVVVTTKISTQTVSPESDISSYGAPEPISIDTPWEESGLPSIVTSSQDSLENDSFLRSVSRLQKEVQHLQRGSFTSQEYREHCHDRPFPSVGFKLDHSNTRNKQNNTTNKNCQASSPTIMKDQPCNKSKGELGHSINSTNRNKCSGIASNQDDPSGLTVPQKREQIPSEPSNGSLSFEPAEFNVNDSSSGWTTLLGDLSIQDSFIDKEVAKNVAFCASQTARTNIENKAYGHEDTTPSNRACLTTWKEVTRSAHQRSPGNLLNYSGGKQSTTPGSCGYGSLGVSLANSVSSSHTVGMASPSRYVLGSSPKSHSPATQYHPASPRQNLCKKLDSLKSHIFPSAAMMTLDESDFEVNFVGSPRYAVRSSEKIPNKNIQAYQLKDSGISSFGKFSPHKNQTSACSIPNVGRFSPLKNKTSANNPLRICDERKVNASVRVNDGDCRNLGESTQDITVGSTNDFYPGYGPRSSSRNCSMNVSNLPIPHLSSQHMSLIQHTAAVNKDSSTSSQCSCHSVQTVEHLVTDNDVSFVLVENHFPVDEVVSPCQHSGSPSLDDTVLYWDDLKTLPSSGRNNGSASTTPAAIPADIRELSNTSLRSLLEGLGDLPGPITHTTRRLYENRLLQLRSDPALAAANQKKAQQGYSSELGEALTGKLDVSSLYELEDQMSKPFMNPDPTRQWREGTRKTSLNYLLLDPRVTHNLPNRAKVLGTEEAFCVFIKAIFYVGKGKRSRPYAHFKEAIQQLNMPNKEASRKVEHILSIWGEDLGVVSLHLFQSVIPVEAYTREACMIEALGRSRLTNIKAGDFYGPAATWNRKQRRLLGVRLLQKAFRIFLSEGERQMKPGDIKVQ